MISLRGSEITLQPLSLFETGKVFDHLMALKACNPPADMLRPENRQHLLTVIAAAVRRHIPDASHEEIEEALDLANIGPVLLALVPYGPIYTHKEPGHV
jgi:hypothetical protein